MYFNSYTDSCLSNLFIGEDLQILFPCYSKGDYNRIDISDELELNHLRELLTSELILLLNQCCDAKGCPDTIHGYYLMIKNRENVNFQYIDIDYIATEKCGTNELKVIIDIFKDTSNNNHQQIGIWAVCKTRRLLASPSSSYVLGSNIEQQPGQFASMYIKSELRYF